MFLNIRSHRHEWGCEDIGGNAEYLLHQFLLGRCVRCEIPRGTTNLSRNNRANNASEVQLAVTGLIHLSVSVYPSFPSFLFWGDSQLPTSCLAYGLGRLESEWEKGLCNPLPSSPCSPPFPSSALSQTTRNIWTENREFRTHPSPPWMSPTMLGSDFALGVWTPYCYPTKPRASVAFLSWLCRFLRRACGWILLLGAGCVVQSV